MVVLDKLEELEDWADWAYWMQEDVTLNQKQKTGAADRGSGVATQRYCANGMQLSRMETSEY